MIIDCISDLHGAKPKLEGGDLLIVAGDLTAKDDFQGWLDFVAWIQLSKYKKKIVIGGNHDNWFIKNPPKENTFGDDCSYLCDSGTEFVYYPPLRKDMPDGTELERKTFKIWGSPWSLTFDGMNPHCKAFTVDTEKELAEKWALIPDDIDILITHSPPFSILDEAMHTHNYQSVGSRSLTSSVERIRPKLHVFGHIHEGYGILRYNYDDIEMGWHPIFVNASIMDVNYRPSNKPIRVTL